MSRLRVLVTGASSLPGYRMVETLARRGYEVYAVYRSRRVEFPGLEVKLLQLDLTDYQRVAATLHEVKPDVIIHMAAYSDVDGCEVNKREAYRVNVEATRFLAKLSSRLKATQMIYLSTDYVFDGEKGGYREDDPPNPINYYGLTKLLGEEVVLSAAPSPLVVRTSAIYGIGPGKPNFGKILVERLSRGEKVKAFVDQRLSPTLNTLLAEAILELMERGERGVYHVAGEPVTRYEFAKRLAEKLGFDSSLVEPACMSMFSFRARRPRDSSLDSSRARRLVRVDFHSLDYSLERLAEELGVRR